MTKRSWMKLLCMLQICFLFFGGLTIVLPHQAQAAANVKEYFQVSGGVNYKDTRLSTSSTKQAIRTLEVNMNDPYTTVGIGIPNPLNRLAKTTTQALEHHTQGNLVVGAINGNFFYNGPMNLISKDNRLVHAGTVYSGKDKYVNEPIAFGVTASGKGLIDHYNIQMNFVHNGTTYPITNTNVDRSTGETILYTSNYTKEYPNTNEYGTELVVTMPNAPTLEFGAGETGVVESIRHTGDKNHVYIPKNGFVISAHGDAGAAISHVQVGDSISLSIDVDEKWKNSAYMIASGPMLVKDGQVSLSMDPNSPNAKQRAPRTAVATDATGEKVFLVTVDGRQKGYSNGMTLTEFAEYLVSIGANRALNFDGGGSTTMAVRYPGTTAVKLANSPSDGKERSVSAILMAVSTAPPGKVKTLDVKKSKEGSILVGETITVSPTFAMDEFYNPITVAASDLALTEPNGLGTINGNTFTATQVGKSNITVTVGDATVNVPIEVVDKPLFSDIKSPFWAEKEIAYLVKKGIISGYPDGTFKPNATINRSHAAIMLTKALNLDTNNVQDPGFKDVPKSYPYYKEIAAAANAGLLKGKGSGKFDVNGQLTRAEMAAILQRAFEIPNVDTKYFSDVSKNHFAYNAINAVTAQGIAAGYPDGTFKPSKSVTRTEFSVFLYRSLTK